jgi:cytochrome c oxidase subunit 4
LDLPVPVVLFDLIDQLSRGSRPDTSHRRGKRDLFMAHVPQHPVDPHDHAEHHGIGHVVSPKILIATAVGLLTLTVLTVMSAKIDFAQVDLPELNVFVALAIAVLKASLVCLFFMHLRWDRPFNSFVLVVALALVGLFISFAMTDSFEYRSEIKPGESTEIQMKLAELQTAPQQGGAAPDGKTGAGH